MGTEVKVCKECMRLNPLDVEFCLGCGGEDFDDFGFVPPWDSAIPYLEEDNSK